MKIMNVKYLSLFLVLSFGMVSLTSCSKKKGCTDPTSDTFDPDAEVEDGSCIPAKEKFLGTYSVIESCASGNYDYTITITESASDEASVVITNFGAFGSPIVADVSQSEIFVNNQSIQYNGAGLSIQNGVGSINGNNLTITYSYSNAEGTETCTMNGLKL